MARLMVWLKSLLEAQPASPVQKQIPPPLSPYRREVQHLWQTAIVGLSSAKDIAWAANQILSNRARYEKVALSVSMPFYIIGVIHMREAAFNFNCHFANGDPLLNAHGEPQKTVHVPKGLGPYANWEESAIAAIKLKKFDKFHWDIVNALENLEIWNGLGYKNNGLGPSPFVWSKTNHYTRGKYVADGKYDPMKVDPQLGCAAVLLALKGQGIDLNEVIL